MLRRERKWNPYSKLNVPQSDVIQCSEKVQLKDQENGKITKIQQYKKALEREHKNLVDMHYKEIMEKGEEISRLRDHVWHK